jgi:hypothetical protein
MFTSLSVIFQSAQNQPRIARRQYLPTVWRKFASSLVDAQPLPTRHHMQEGAPDRWMISS